MSNKGFLGFLVGGITGAVIALLYTPRSGKETREILIEDVQDIKDKAIQAIDDVQHRTLDMLEDTQARLLELNQETMDRLGKLQDIGQATLEEQKQSLDKGIKAAADVILRDVSKSERSPDDSKSAVSEKE